ncbi:PREDICTED: uncharacterized protein LOC107070690 isoform X2 [Polistes dominula]|uniref:Uncharacterized protein LOC107070689 isoform X2 n=1 Tax=Polistes dominula TaxID=743375 RepID=A0ABM1IWM4_POLDO|nr:PREDICTED: uncharacterized protein LOC107070689 isoform X2 [Polistes dominula]XP_015184613.1 PREDICTED: uncharacterized protein LOC107070690 isoform X2 [Polistes dominula]
MLLLFMIHLVDVLFVFGSPLKNEYADNGCSPSIRYKDDNPNGLQPLVLTRDATVSKILYPQKNRMLKVQTGQSIYLECPGDKNFVRPNTNLKEVKATCVGNNMFNVNGENKNFSAITCSYVPEDIARRTNSWCYDNKSTYVEIGFNLTTNFLPLIKLCYNEETYITYYAKFRMTKWIGETQKCCTRQFVKGDFFGNININNQYQITTQRDTLTILLNSREWVESNINTSQCLTRGHLVAMNYFVYNSMQLSTFWFINTAPQWSSFNSGNWNILENNVRALASNRSLDLDVYIGVHGQMTLPNFNKTETPIYLYVNGTTKALPVPKFFWKIIYDPQSKKGTAFVGLNHPFIKSITKDIYICNDISSTINWLTWEPRNIRKGISYACTVEDLRRAVPTIPKLTTSGVLT